MNFNSCPVNGPWRSKYVEKENIGPRGLGPLGLPRCLTLGRRLKCTSHSASEWAFTLEIREYNLDVRRLGPLGLPHWLTLGRGLKCTPHPIHVSKQVKKYESKKKSKY